MAHALKAVIAVVTTVSVGLSLHALTRPPAHDGVWLISVILVLIGLGCATALFCRQGTHTPRNDT